MPVVHVGLWNQVDPNGTKTPSTRVLMTTGPMLMDAYVHVVELQMHTHDIQIWFTY
jgi:hypothetical protein